MNLKAKYVLSIVSLGLLCLMLPGSIRADTVNINSINANSSPFFVDISTTNLLAQYGITLTKVTPGTTVDVVCGECGGNSIVSSSPPNVLFQGGNDNGMSYTLQFSTPLSTLSFSLAGNSKSGGSGTLVAAWSATAFDASGNVVSRVGDPSLFGTFSSFAPQPFTLTGPGIASVTFFTQCFNVCGTGLNIADLSAPEIKLALSAPTNLHATQGSSGTKIHLTWDYGTNPIDGFVIEREVPSGTFEELATRPLPSICTSGHCAVDDSGLTVGGSAIVPYGTYSYRVRAFKGTTDSNPSNTTTSWQIALFSTQCHLDMFGSVICGAQTSLDSSKRTNDNTILAQYKPQPSVTVGQVARTFGYDHFNWVSIINHFKVPRTVSDAAGNLLKAPWIDPPLGGYGSPIFQPSDDLPYYWDENTVKGADPRLALGALFSGGDQKSSEDTFFRDLAHDPLIPPGDYIGFFTTLVGVKTPVGVSPPDYTALSSFAWYTTYTDSTGGVGRLSNVDPPTNPGTGGIFNASVVGTDDLPLDIRQLLVQNGAQGVSTAPKIDTDAPTTAAFFAGPQGTNGWYTGPVTATLVATDVDGSSDIASTTYGLDGRPLVEYQAPFTISEDGIHTLQFSSVDKSGNTESPDQLQTVKIDTTPPEAFIQFDPVSHDLLLFARDAVSGVTPGPIAPARVVFKEHHEGDRDDDRDRDHDGLNDKDRERHTEELRTYNVLDLAGNVLVLTEKIHKTGHSISGQILSLQYGNRSVITPPRNTQTFAWETDRDGSLRRLEQHLEVGTERNEQDISAHFDAEENETDIRDESKHGHRDAPGLVLLRMVTNDGNLFVQF